MVWLADSSPSLWIIFPQCNLQLSITGVQYLFNKSAHICLNMIYSHIWWCSVSWHQYIQPIHSAHWSWLVFQRQKPEVTSQRSPNMMNMVIIVTSLPNFGRYAGSSELSGGNYRMSRLCVLVPRVWHVAQASMERCWGIQMHMWRQQDSRL